MQTVLRPFYADFKPAMAFAGRSIPVRRTGSLGNKINIGCISPLGRSKGIKMCITEFKTLVSAADGLPLSLMIVRPEGAPRALVQFSHGMCEHKERYAPFMEYLAERGCACVINDHRGHGASVRRAEDLGYFYEGGDAAVVEDLHQITLRMREQWPGLPLFLFGHSMGSLAARAYCAHYDRDIDALALCGSPGSHSAPELALGLGLIRLLSLFGGDRRRSRILQKMTTGAFARRFADPEHPCAWISANPENVIAYEADPLCNFNFTLNGNRALLRLMRRAYGLRPERGNPDLSVRFFSGAEDPCAPDARGFENAVEAMRRAGYRDVQGRIFPGMRHEILNEADSAEVFAAIWREAFEPHL